MPKVFCKKCNQALTEELTIIDTAYLYQRVDVRGDLPYDFIPSGKIYYNTGKIAKDHKETWLSGLRNEYQIKNHTDTSRLTINCCYLDGSAGINAMCNNSHEVATRIGDCFMYNYIAWDPEKTELK